MFRVEHFRGLEEPLKNLHPTDLRGNAHKEVFAGSLRVLRGFRRIIKECLFLKRTLFGLALRNVKVSGWHSEGLPSFRRTRNGNSDLLSWFGVRLVVVWRKPPKNNNESVVTVPVKEHGRFLGNYGVPLVRAQILSSYRALISGVRSKRRAGINNATSPLYPCRLGRRLPRSLSLL